MKQRVQKAAQGCATVLRWSRKSGCELRGRNSVNTTHKGIYGVARRHGRDSKVMVVFAGGLSEEADLCGCA